MVTAQGGKYTFLSGARKTFGSICQRLMEILRTRGQNEGKNTDTKELNRFLVHRISKDFIDATSANTLLPLLGSS